MHLEGHRIGCDILDLDINVDREQCTNEKIRVVLSGDGLDLQLDFSLSADLYFRPVSPDNPQIHVIKGRDSINLIDYMNANPLNFHFADQSRLNGSNLYSFDARSLEPFEKDQIEVIDWENRNVNITREFSSEEDEDDGLVSIHEFLADYLAVSDCSVVIYDHRTGEVADFVAFCETDTYISVRLYHAKKSSEPKPGKRVEDVYDVCGQATKSIKWFNRNEILLSKLKHRIRRGSTFVRGNLEELQGVFDRMSEQTIRYQVIVVQPGISKNKINEDLQRVLAASGDYLKRAKGEELLIFGSD